MALEPAFVTSFASRQMSQQLVAWASARQTRWDDQDLAQSLDRLIARQDRHRAPVKEWMRYAAGATRRNRDDPWFHGLQPHKIA
jgi:hypothetical protein